MKVKNSIALFTIFSLLAACSSEVVEEVGEENLSQTQSTAICDASYDANLSHCYELGCSAAASEVDDQHCRSEADFDFIMDSVMYTLDDIAVLLSCWLIPGNISSAACIAWTGTLPRFAARLIEALKLLDPPYACTPPMLKKPWWVPFTNDIYPLVIWFYEHIKAVHECREQCSIACDVAYDDCLDGVEGAWDYCPAP